MPRALLATLHFELVAGSELVLLEVAEHLLARGFTCDIAASWIDAPMRDLAARPGLTLIDRPAAIRPLTYDFAWIQNRLEPVMDWAPGPDEAPATFFAFAHLDLHWTLSQPGLLEDLLADACLVTSPEAAAHFAAAGLPEARTLLLRNAAPAGFERPAAAPRPALRRLLVISNHAPPELVEAAALLRAQGIAVAHWGLGGDTTGQRITPEALDAADAVVSIGKTIPYALLGRIPAFVYDHFGGPGWLSEANFAPAAAVNFSGRCCRRRLDAVALAAEITTGFPDAATFAAARAEAELAPYRLAPILDALLALPAPPAAARHALLAEHRAALRREAPLARAAADYFTHWRHAEAALAVTRAHAQP